MRLDDLAPAPGARRARRRVGRGTGGKGGKTAGRGTKGQLARNKVNAGFEGGQLPLTQRIPKQRGFQNPFRVEYNVVNLDDLEKLAVDAVTPETLRASGIVHEKGLVKVLGRGSLSRAIAVEAHAFSQTAARAITAAGGSVKVVPRPQGDRRVPARGNALANR
jgi:large subunit ribosomal protein L15